MFFGIHWLQHIYTEGSSKLNLNYLLSKMPHLMKYKYGILPFSVTESDPIMLNQI